MEYQITKKKIKNYIIRIYPDGKIKVSVPLNATKTQIEKFIQNKKEWLDKTLKKLEDKRENNEKNKIKILGKTREVRVIKSEIDMIRISDKSIYIYSKEESLSFEKLNKILENWKFEKLNTLLKEYLDKYLNLLNTSIKIYKIKKMSSAWGIYHTKENYISFNFQLIEKEEECIEYVVLHELCHIFYPNHQKYFWELVGKYMPNYKQFRRKLKE